MNNEKIINELENQLKKFVGNKKAVIGLSGGIDSALVATLCLRALGKDNVLGILMPYENQDTADAKLLAEFLDIPTKEVNIKEIVDKFDFEELDRLSKGNIMARVRMTVLYTYANKLNGLVIGTGNKSEIKVGYLTKYGDGGIDVEPIGDLYKTEVVELSKFLKIPESIITKKPSAGFWDNQTDEEEMGVTYAILDSVLKGEITSGEDYEKVQKLVKNSQHKRKMPPVFEVKRK